MKAKHTYTLAIFFMIVISFLFGSFSVPKERYHQHVRDRQPEARKEVETEDFMSHLPIMEVETEAELPHPFIYPGDGTKERNNEAVHAAIHYYDAREGDNILGSQPTIVEQADFRIRGRSSREFDKKSYLVKFKKDNWEDNKKVPLSGMTADSEWALHGPFLDKSLIRNYLSYNLAGEIMDYSPNVRFMELFLNGDYQGLYLLTEKIEYNEDGRINITESKPKLASTSYILALNPGSNNPFNDLNTFNNYTGQYGPADRRNKILEVVYPNTTLTLEQKNFIADEISLFERSLLSFDSADRKLGYPSFIDVESFVDYLIINEFTMNTDAGRLSTYFYKDIRGKLKTAVWDFNSAFNNYVPDNANPQYFVMLDKVWFEHLLKDPAFVEKVIRRYHQLRKNYLSDDYLLDYIDETIAYLGPAVDRNNEVWGYSFAAENDLLRPKERNPRSYEEAVDQLKEMIIERGAYMDANIESLRALSHESMNKFFREDK